MAFPAPHASSADDLDVLTAHIPNLNATVAGDFVADREALPKVTQSRQFHLS